MKKLSIVFAFVILCFTAQAQSKSDLVGKWGFDFDETTALTPNGKAQLAKMTETQKEQYRKMYSTTYMEFKADGSMVMVTYGVQTPGKYTLEGKKIATTIAGVSDVMVILSYKDDVLVVNNEVKKQKVALKRKK